MTDTDFSTVLDTVASDCTESAMQFAAENNEAPSFDLSHSLAHIGNEEFWGVETEPEVYADLRAELTDMLVSRGVKVY